NPREINLFYLKDDMRERLEQKNGGYAVNNTDIFFSGDALEKELTDFPERFSPNVILRGLFQETILPNIAFVGGGGELAYWLELKPLFEHYSVPFPVSILRNSFLVLNAEQDKLAHKLGFDFSELFKTEVILQGELVKK